MPNVGPANDSIWAVAIVKGENQKNNNCELQNHRVLKGNCEVTDNPVGEC